MWMLSIMLIEESRSDKAGAPCIRRSSPLHAWLSLVGFSLGPARQALHVACDVTEDGPIGSLWGRIKSRPSPEQRLLLNTCSAGLCPITAIRRHPSVASAPREQQRRAGKHASSIHTSASCEPPLDKNRRPIVPRISSGNPPGSAVPAARQCSDETPE